MKTLTILLLITLLLIPLLPISSAAHFIVGFVNNASDTASPNDKTILLWNPTNGINDNLTDTIGPSGNSGADNIYLIDCELLNTPCNIGDEIRTQVLNSGDGYTSDFVNTTVTGAGFDIMPNITLNSPPIVSQITVDDSLATPLNEIDLIPATTQEITCQGVVFEHDGNQTITNITAEFFDNTNSFYGDSDDNNLHYANTSCALDLGYGNTNQAAFNCTMQIEYYSNPGTWNCTAQVTDTLNVAQVGSNTTNINTLLALSIPSPIDFGETNASEVGKEAEINVTNVGNSQLNLTLSGYANTEGDGLAMNCSLGNTTIQVHYSKYNLTASNPGTLTLPQFENLYTNLTSSPIVKLFNLAPRQNDLAPNTDDTNSTYWRMYAPGTVAGDCSGNIIFGAVQSGES